MSDTVADNTGGPIALVPARAGSKGIPGKNTKPLGGLPLIVHTITFCLDANTFERIVVTTDSHEIAAIAEAAGAEVPFMRPEHLGLDDTPMLRVVQHALRELSVPKSSILALMQPTSPFRQTDDLRRGVHVLRDVPEADSVVSVERVPDDYLPERIMAIRDGYLVPYLDGEIVERRQDATTAYSRNGQFYLMRAQVPLFQDSLYGNRCEPIVTTHRAFNLDTPDDWKQAEDAVASGLEIIG